MRDNKIGQQGGKLTLDLENSSLQQFDFRYNSIGVQESYLKLKLNSSQLTWVEIRYNPLSLNAVKAFMENIKASNLTQLRFEENNLSKEALVTILAKTIQSKVKLIEIKDRNIYHATTPLNIKLDTEGMQRRPSHYLVALSDCRTPILEALGLALHDSTIEYFWLGVPFFNSSEEVIGLMKGLQSTDVLYMNVYIREKAYRTFDKAFLATFLANINATSITAFYLQGFTVSHAFFKLLVEHLKPTQVELLGIIKTSFNFEALKGLFIELAKTNTKVDKLHLIQSTYDLGMGLFRAKSLIKAVITSSVNEIGIEKEESRAEKILKQACLKKEKILAQRQKVHPTSFLSRIFSFRNQATIPDPEVTNATDLSY